MSWSWQVAALPRSALVEREELSTLEAKERRLHDRGVALRRDRSALLAQLAAAGGSGHVEAPANGIRKQSSSAHRWKSYFSAEAEKLKQADAARGRLAR